MSCIKVWTVAIQDVHVLWRKLADLMCHQFGIMLSRKSIFTGSYKSSPMSSFCPAKLMGKVTKKMLGTSKMYNLN